MIEYSLLRPPAHRPCATLAFSDQRNVEQGKVGSDLTSGMADQTTLLGFYDRDLEPG